jgi:hypothetical protein
LVGNARRFTCERLPEAEEGMMPVWASAPTTVAPAFPPAPDQERERRAGADISCGEL